MPQRKTPVITEKVLLAIIAAITTISMPLIAFYTIQNNYKSEEMISKIDTLHSNVNGKIQLLLDANKDAAFAEGKLEQIAVQDSLEKK